MTGGRKEHMIARIGTSFLPLLLSSLIAVKLPRLPLQPSPPGITFFSVCGPSALASFDGSGLSARSPPADNRTSVVWLVLPYGAVGTTTVRSIEMYGMVLMAAMTGSADMTEIGHHNRGGCHGSMVYSGGCTGSGAVVGGCTGSGIVMGSCHGGGHHARGNCHGGGGGLFHRGNSCHGGGHHTRGNSCHGGGGGLFHRGNSCHGGYGCTGASYGGGCTGVIVNQPAPMPAPQPQPQPAPMPAPAPAVSAAPCCAQRPPAALRLARSTACSIVVAAAVAAKRFADRLHEQREPQGSRSSFPGPLSCRIAPMRIPHARRRK